MGDLFDRATAGDYILETDLNQIFDSWEGETGKGIPLRLTEVSSATYYAGDFCNQHANGYHLRVKNASGENLMRFILSDVYLDKNMAVAASATVDGIDLSEHIHSGDSNDAPQLTADSYTNDSVGIDALAAGGMYLPKRQGGSATEWATSGITDYTLTGKVQVLGGTVVPTGTWTAMSATMEYGTATVTFPTAFAHSPLCFVQPTVSVLNQYCLYCTIVAASTTALTIRIWHNTADGTALDGVTLTSKAIHWLAIGPKA